MFQAPASRDPNSPEFQEAVRAIVGVLRRDRPVSPETSFAEIEDEAHALGRRIAQEFCHQAAAEQAAVVEHQDQPCPDCGRDCSGTVATRTLLTRDGPVELPEAKHHCPHCRRAFFPLPTAPRPEPPRL